MIFSNKFFTNAFNTKCKKIIYLKMHTYNKSLLTIAIVLLSTLILSACANAPLKDRRHAQFIIIKHAPLKETAADQYRSYFDEHTTTKKKIPKSQEEKINYFENLATQSDDAKIIIIDNNNTQLIDQYIQAKLFNTYDITHSSAKNIK